MTDLSANLDQLDKLLSALPLDAEAMLLSELDGFLAGLLILPEPLDEAEWLPHIWNHCPLDADEQKVAGEIAGLARLRKAEIALEFRQGEGFFGPVFDLDTDGSLFWEVWFGGYERAITLQDAVYDTLVDSGDENLRKTIFGLAWVALAAHRKLELFKEQSREDDLHEFVPQFLPRLVARLFRQCHGMAVEQSSLPMLENLVPEQRRIAKVGRNEPCPCGSGKKYKKCCGQ